MSELTQRQVEENVAEFIYEWTIATYADEHFQAIALPALLRKLKNCGGCPQERQDLLAGLRAQYDAGVRTRTLYFALIDA